MKIHPGVVQEVITAGGRRAREPIPTQGVWPTGSVIMIDGVAVAVNRAAGRDFPDPLSLPVNATCNHRAARFAAAQVRAIIV